MMYSIRDNGWISVLYRGPENAKVEIGLSHSGRTEQATWATAYFDFNSSGKRIVTIPPPEWAKDRSFTGFKVFLRVNGQVHR